MDSSGPAEIAYVALGSNLGDREGWLAAARAALAALPDTKLLAVSDVEETAPLGPPDQPRYLNQVVALKTTLDPTVLLGLLQEIEREHGRIRGERWGPRTLDLDIVRFGDRHVSRPGLDLPHPELPRRTFWQRELEQVESRMRQESVGARR